MENDKGDDVLAGIEVAESFLSDLEMGFIPIAAALSWLRELKREGFVDLAAEIERRWPATIRFG